MTVALITGISGQDGSYLAEALLAQGFTVHGAVRSEAEVDLPAIAHPDVAYHRVDMSEPERLKLLIEDVGPDHIYNLAAMSSVFQSWQQPIQTAAVNAIPVAQILESAWQLQERRGRPVRVVQASSAELFGNAQESPQTELTPVRPTSPYGAAKAYSHHLINVYRGRGLFASSCILYNHESSRRPESFVTRKITASVARISLGLQDRLELGGLDARRDWGWAPDYARALALTVQADEPDDFIIATGISHSIADFARLAFARVGIADWRRFVDLNDAFTRPVDPVAQVGDASKALRVLGWKPTKPFAEIVADMVDNDVSLLTARNA
ncbi:GDP-mannose 4,6-dehydratase [Cryobacterium sp. TMS1-20-1]|uniref:GDP-mannose 4,6-dehydratase n=1 Tax=unclassified Cryobacterium TaxID=2649013 RepID=UPI0010692DF5|nr:MULTISPECIES: GDP-mannose 4,6-dehydratase [unclassified Cryobacterium]TFC72406.1 GDP-mannose 4,6-dehydratase [Cryobacterium sp. TMS1-20-1]TFD55482.1 GDP-mannose 4,6-dehydratase [Cryobacterium sp. Hh7]